MLTTAAAAALTGVLALGANASAQQSSPSPAPAASPAPSPAPSVSPEVEGRASFAAFLGEVRTEALAAGIRAETLDSALTGVEFLPTVLDRDRAQTEFVLSFDDYIKKRLVPETIKKANEMYTLHRDVLRDVGAAYGVAPRFLVAVWGLESQFGAFAGVRPTIPTLATLAYESRRAPFFRAQLMDALRIVDRGDITLGELKGSWAGALGQPQFLPSIYLRIAQDFDKDGRRDIWNTPADVFASIAAYLKEHGWQDRDGWGQEVKGPPVAFARIAREIDKRESGCAARRAMTEALTMTRWRALGVRTAANRSLPRTRRTASLVRAGKRNFLVSPNYDAILSYNCAQSYALSVVLLADRIKER